MFPECIISDHSDAKIQMLLFSLFLAGFPECSLFIKLLFCKIVSEVTRTDDHKLTKMRRNILLCDWEEDIIYSTLTDVNQHVCTVLAQYGLRPDLHHLTILNVLATKIVFTNLSQSGLRDPIVVIFVEPSILGRLNERVVMSSIQITAMHKN